jgi:protein-S-isoprenylcysteine O-methyltransferase Ste14
MNGGSGFIARGGWWVAAQVVAFGIVAIALLWAPERDVPGILSALGWVLVVVGGAMAVDGVYQIRGHLTAYPAPLDHGKLVEHGSYRLVRHPIYGGLVIGVIGLAIAAGNLAALIAGVALAAFFYAKSGFEERLLEDKYVDYPQYQRRVAQRLIPWLL